MKISGISGTEAKTTGINASDTFGFGINDPRLIFKILREKMYSNPKKAAIQEYVCNARDAHREAGKEDLPVQVHFPDFDGSELIIRDFGYGIPPEAMDKVFTKYGASTKRGTDRFTGGWGLGCKTGFAIGDSFSVTSITLDPDGVTRKREYHAYLDESEAGSMTLLTEAETSEETGLAIHLPISSYDISDYEEYLEQTTRYWPVRPVTKGREIEYDKGDFYVQGEDWAIFNHRYGVKPIIVLDGIMYPYRDNALVGVQLSEKAKAFADKPFVLFFRTGELTPTPNREDITYDTEAKLSLTSKIEFIAENFHALMRKQMDDMFTDDMDILSMRDLYVAQEENLRRYLPEASTSLKDRLLPQRMELSNHEVRAWIFDVTNSDWKSEDDGYCPVGQGREISSFTIGRDQIYVVDTSSTSKPTRQRAYGLYSTCKENNSDLNPVVFKHKQRISSIVVIRFKDKDEQTKFYKKYPKFPTLLHGKSFDEYTSKALNKAVPRMIKRGGGTEVRLLDRQKVAESGIYAAFTPFTGSFKNSHGIVSVNVSYGDEKTTLESLKGGVYVVMKDGKVYAPDGFSNEVESFEIIRPVEPIERRRRKRRNTSETEPEVRTLRAGETVRPTGRKVVKFSSYLELSTSVINSIPESVPIFGVFEKGYDLIKDNPTFINVREYNHRRLLRFRQKYEGQIDKGRVFYYPRIQDIFSGVQGGTDFIKFILNLPKFRCPYPELWEWIEFTQKYPNLEHELTRLPSSHAEFYQLVGAKMQIANVRDNRLLWFASALGHGKMTEAQKIQFLELLHTKQLAQHETR